MKSALKTSAVALGVITNIWVDTDEVKATL